MNDQKQTSMRFEWTRRFAPRSVGVRVALAVNLLVVACGIGFLVFAYRQEWRQRMEDKSLALREQAMTLHQAVSGLNRESIYEQQKFIDAVCGRMSDDESPGHHIVVEIDGKALQSQAHHRDSEEELRAIRLAGEQIASGPGNADLLVGKHAESGITVYIGERMASVRTEIRRRAIFRSVGVGGFGILLAVAVNFVIHRLIHKPLRRLVKTIDGIAAGNYSMKVERFDGLELARVAAAIDSMSQALARDDAHRRTSLDRARQVQVNLLPNDSGSNGLDVAFFHRAAEEVAGDYLDHFRTSRGTTILCVADVVGHGIAPAMIAAMLKVLLLEVAEAHDDPGEMLGLLNRRFTTVNLPEDFATMFLAEWRPLTRTLAYVNAGHEPVLLVSQNLAPVFLSSTGPMVGIESATRWQSQVTPIAHGDLLACWTDGITEARNPNDDLLGRDQLIAAIRGRSPTSPQDLLDVIDQVMLEHVAGNSPTDDCTVLAIQFP